MDAPSLTTMRRGGFWRRALALLIDAIIVSVVLSFVLPFIPPGAPPPSFSAYSGSLLGTARDMGWIHLLLQTLAGVAYFVAFESSARMATPGKMLVNLRVVTMDGSRLSIGHALLRYLAKGISALPFCLGFVMAALPQKRALHDIITKTQIVRT